MTNPLKGEVKLALDDGRQFTLVLDFEALIAAEGFAKKPLPMLMAEAQAGFVGAVRALFWGALQRHHDDLTVAEVTAIMTSNLDRITQAIGEAGDAAMPDAAEGDNAGNRKARRAGKASGSSGAKPG
jgi:hypothetical protein